MAEIDRTLADLTGLEFECFDSEENASVLLILSGLFCDDNKKVIAALLLRIKNKERYDEVCKRLLQSVDPAKLSPRVKALLKRDTHDPQT